MWFGKNRERGGTTKRGDMNEVNVGIDNEDGEKLFRAMKSEDGDERHLRGFENGRMFGLRVYAKLTVCV